MQKKLIAVAVAGALVAPAAALAQSSTSTVQIYGRLIVNYNFLDQGDSKPNIDMLNSHDANLGFRGEERLGSGLSAWFQCESTADVTGNEAFEKGFCARNSAVGLKGDWGNFFAGNWDVAAKNSSTPARIWSTSGAYGNAELLWNGSASNAGNGAGSAGAIGTASTGTAAAGFSRRQANSIHYHSPVWSGFQIQGSMSTLNESTAATNATTASKARMYSLGAQFRHGDLYLGAGYEKHSDYNPASQATYTGGDDTMWSIAAAYTFAKVFQISGIYTSIEYDLANALSTKRNSYGIYGQWNIQGPHTLKVGYTKADDTKGTGGNVNSTGNCGAGGVAINSGWCSNGGAGDTGADLFGIQYNYAFSKRTSVNFGYAQVDNDRLARYALQTLSRPASAGQKSSAWVLGIDHRF